MISVLNANSCFLKIKANKSDSDKTDIVSHHELYIFVRMPFVLKNVPETFQQKISNLIF